MKHFIFTLVVSAVMAGQAWAGTWIQVSNGPGRITTYSGGGRFDAQLFNTASGGNPTGSLLVTCVDFLNVFSYGERWQVNFTRIDGSDTLGNTRFGGSLTNNGNANNFDNYQGTYNAMDRYRMAAWLTSQLPNHLGSSLNRQGIQGAIWYLLDPTGTPNAPLSSTSGWFDNRNHWLQQAINTGLSQSESFYSRYRVVTQVGVSWLGNGTSTRYQEFITEVVPEPSTYAALAMGVLGVVCAVRRRKQNA